MTDADIEKTISDYYEHAFDFSNGYNMTNEDERQYIKDCIIRVSRRLEEYPMETNDYSRISCGNLCVTVFGVRTEPGKYEFDIMVTRSRKEYTHYHEDKNYIFRI